MSYDLKLFRVPQGVEPEAAYWQLVDREESEIVNIKDRETQILPDATRASMQQLVDAVKTRWPAFEQFHSAAPLRCIELSDHDLEIQFSVYDQTASITVPYFRERTTQLMECVKCCLEVCQEERGYVAYDNQLGRIVTVADLAQVAQTYRWMDSKLPIIMNSQVPETKSKSWWKFW